MTRSSSEELEWMRRAFTNGAETGQADEGALDADRIWLAVRGEL